MLIRNLQMRKLSLKQPRNESLDLKSGFPAWGLGFCSLQPTGPYLRASGAHTGVTDTQDSESPESWALPTSRFSVNPAQAPV